MSREIMFSVLSHEGVYANTMSTAARTSSENVTWRFCNHFLIIQSHYACKMCSKYPGIKLEPALRGWEDKIEHFSSHGHVVYTTAKQVISRSRKNENVSEMSKIKTARAKRAKLLFFTIKYANLWLSCCRRRRGCVNSLFFRDVHYSFRIKIYAS